MKVFIYSIPRPSAFGIQDWTGTSSGKKMLKTKIGKCKDGRQAPWSPKYAGYVNGLSYKPWVENGEQLKDTQGIPLTLQDKMEQKWNLPKGYLTNKAWMRGDSMREEDMTYYQRKRWPLNDGCTVLDLTNFDDEMFYYVCLDASFCANSETEWRQGKWHKATHYIALENEAEEIKFNKNQIKSKAFSDLHNADLTPTMKAKFVAILELSNAFSNLTQEQIHNLLFEYVDKSTFTPNSNIDKLNRLNKLLETPTGREEIEAMFLLKQALDSRIIYEKQGSYNWVRPEGHIVLGENYGEAIGFLNNPKKTILVEELQREIKLKTV